MKSLALLLLLLLLSGCATGYTHLEPMNCSAPPFVQQATVTWVRVPDAKAECAKIGWGATTFAGGGCTQCRTHEVPYVPGPGIPPISPFKTEHRFCTVIMQDPEKVADEVAGHEFKHVFGCNHAKGNS